MHIRGTWFENGFVCDMANLNNPDLRLEYRDGRLIDADHGFEVNLEDAGRGAMELTGWPSGQTFLIHPCDVETVKVIAAGL